MATGQQMQRIGKIKPFDVPSQRLGDARPLRYVDAGESEQMFDDSHKVFGNKTVKSTQCGQLGTSCIMI
jgi:hypothetical protein